MHYILGIDEVGRGPWAGPIVVAGFLCKHNFDTTILLGGKSDSKKITPKERERIVQSLENAREKDFSLFLTSREANEIDALGIRECNKRCMHDIITQAEKVIHENDTLEIHIDGCDNFIFDALSPYTYTFAKKGAKKEQKQEKKGQKHITYTIGGDGSIDVIGLASIFAKVKRDQRMCEYSEKFPKYSFQKHKGYGTRKHREEILNYGITEIHRKSYEPCKTLILRQGWV